MKGYEEDDEGMDAIFVKENEGGGGAGNGAVRKGEGGYVGFLERDDVWKGEKVDKQVGFMRKDEDGL